MGVIFAVFVGGIQTGIIGPNDPAAAPLAVAFIVLTFLEFGWAPYAAFLDHLPGLLGGEAFPAFRNPMAMAINFSSAG